jgi:hypothetical protein
MKGLPHGARDISEEKRLNAYEQAVWILDDKGRALRVVSRAAAQVPVTVIKQEQNWKRGQRYNARRRRPRSRAYLDYEQIFDLLVLRFLTIEERNQERHGLRLNTEDRIKRLIKQIVEILLNHNSYWAVIAVCRIICSYERKDIDRVYNVIAPNRAFTKAIWDQANTVRNAILDILVKRFSIEKEEISSEDLGTLDQSDWRVELIKETLERFLPTHRRVLVPAGYDWNPSDPLIPYVEDDEDAEWGDETIEVDRMCMLMQAIEFNKIAESEGVTAFEQSVRNLRFWQ